MITPKRENTKIYIVKKKSIELKMLSSLWAAYSFGLCVFGEERVN